RGPHPHTLRAVFPQCASRSQEEDQLFSCQFATLQRMPGPCPWQGREGDGARVASHGRRTGAVTSSAASPTGGVPLVLAMPGENLASPPDAVAKGREFSRARLGTRAAECAGGRQEGGGGTTTSSTETPESGTTG